MSLIEIIGFIVTLAAIILATRAHVLTWPLQMFASLLYVWLFLDAHLFGESALQLIYAVLAVYGWVKWKQNKQIDLLVTRMSGRDLLILNGVGIVAAIVVSTLQVSFLPTDVPILDSMVLVFGLLAQWLQARKKIENWLYWIVIDLLAAGIYWHKDLQLTAFLYLILTGLAINGWWQWRKIVR